MRPEDATSIVLRHSEVASPLLVPELRLHLITPGQPLWRAGEADLVRLGLTDPYWGFCWPGGQSLARHVLDHPHLVEGRRVLDLGTGCGVVALAAARAGAARVTAIDSDPMAVAATRLNAELNQAAVDAAPRDLLEVAAGAAEVVLAGDVTYEPELARRVLRHLRQLSAAGATVLFADPHRGHLTQEDLALVATYRAPAEIDVGGRFFQTTSIYRV